MVKRRNKNKKEKRKGGGWKEVRDMYDPIHKELPSDPEPLPEPPSVKNVSVPHRKSPRSRLPSDTHTIKPTKWTDIEPGKMTLKNISNLVEDNDVTVDTNPDEVVIREESKRNSDRVPDWAKSNPYSLKLSRNKRGGSRRKYKSSKKKQKHKSSKRRKSNKRRYTKSSKRKYSKRL